MAHGAPVGGPPHRLRPTVAAPTGSPRVIWGIAPIAAGVLRADTAGMPTPPSVLVIIGPSASGKSSVLSELDRRGLVRVRPTWCTRPPRPDEEAGTTNHVFVDDREFDRLDRGGFFLCTGGIQGLHYRYGLPRFADGCGTALDTVILRADYVTMFRRHYPRAVVYLVTAPHHDLTRRLGRRDDPPHVVAARVVANRHEETAGAALADRTFVNAGSVPELADAVKLGLVADGALDHPSHHLDVPA